MTPTEAEKIIEGLIFAAPYPVSSSELGKILEMEPSLVERLVERIKDRYMDSGIMIRMVAGGYQFVTRPELAPWVERLGRPIITAPLSQAALETLAIIAYQQPVTKGEIEQIRGVRADTVLNNLMERELIEEVGRKEGPGRPILYGTTENFLLHFGLKGLHELPERETFMESAATREE